MSDQEDTGQAAALLSEAGATLKRTIVPAVKEALLELPEEEAFALEMSLLEGEDDASIASMMGVTEKEVQTLREEAREQLLETELGQELGRSGLRKALGLTGRYWREHRGHDAEKFQRVLEKSLNTAEAPSLPERLSESMERLWQQVVDEFDATAEQVVGAGTTTIQGFGSAQALAAPEEGGEERAEFSFEMPEEDLYGTLIREMEDQWRIVFEVHKTGMEGARVVYEIATTTGTVLHEGTVELKEFGKGIYEGGEAIGPLEIPPGAEPQVRVVEWKDN
jgi:hypothetical protein